MIRTTRRIACWLAALSLTGAGLAGAAKEPFCLEAENDLAGRVFYAEVPLYDTEVGPDEIWKIERDEEEIRKGDDLYVVDVDCGKKKIQLTLKPGNKGEKVEIYLYLSRDERAAEDARETFDRMLGYVLREEGDEEDEPDG